VIVVAALARSKDAKGRSSYSDGLGLASFRETSELEYGCDDAFLLVPDDDGDRVVLKHLKSRHGAATDVPLRFVRARQRFDDFEPTATPETRRAALMGHLHTLRQQTPAAADGDGEGADP
jgi:replicative DNA helicase